MFRKNHLLANILLLAAIAASLTLLVGHALGEELSRSAGPLTEAAGPSAFDAEKDVEGIAKQIEAPEDMLPGEIRLPPEASLQSERVTMPGDDPLPGEDNPVEPHPIEVENVLPQTDVG